MRLPVIMVKYRIGINVIPNGKKNGMGSGESDIKKTCAGACVVMRKNKSNIYEPDEKQMTYDD